MSAESRTNGAYVMLFVLALVVLMQGTLVSRVRFFGARPDLLLTVIVCWSLLSDVTTALLWAFLAGLGIDLVAGMPLGSSSLALILVAFLGSMGRNSVYANSGLLPVALILLATFLHGLIMLGMQQVRGVPVDWLGSIVRVVTPAMVLNVLLLLPTMQLMRRLSTRLTFMRAG